MIQTKAELLDTLRACHAEMEAALAQVGEERMSEPGASGHWSVKDVLAHIAVSDDWLADEIARAASGGALPSAEELRKMQAEGLFDNETRNTLYYQQHKDDALANVLAWRRRAHDRYLAVLEAAPDAVLSQPDWWTGGRPILGVQDPTHEREHAEGIRAWLSEAREQA